MSKFVQITAALASVGGFGGRVDVYRLYALDEEGYIWEWDGAGWRTLPLPNQETPT